ncbi:Flp family type IVb pilin [Neobacillus sp. LXY-4]|uniref:Flp family type IVb pilin n=1 Tax=Neobacillus sp. LXY-4 TaxID=3379826 RepID=UPI003EE3A705
MLEKMKNLVVEEEGQGMVEYGLIIALIGIVVAAAFPTLTDALAALFTKVAGKL